MSLRHILSLLALTGFIGLGVTACDTQTAGDAANEAVEATESAVEKTEEVLQEADGDAKKEEETSSN